MLHSCWKWTVITVAAAVFLAFLAPGRAQQNRTDKATDPIPLSDEERAWLAEHADLRLGMWLESPPIIFRGEDGAMQGLVPAYIDIINNKLGLKPRRVRASSLAAMQQLARAHEVDMVSAMFSNANQDEGMVPSEPYLFMPIVIVTRSDFRFVSGLADLEGRVVAMEAAHVPHQRIPKDYPGIHPLVVDSPASGLQAVMSGGADAFVGSQPSVAYLSRRLGFNDLRISAITEYSYSLSVGVRRDWPILLALVNRVLASIGEEERKGINDYWTVLREGQWMARPKAWGLIGVVSAIAGVLVLLFLFRNRSLAREVARRKIMEQDLRRAHESTWRIIESAHVIIVGLDYSGHVRMINGAGEAALGYSRDELEGRDWFETAVPRERFPFVWDEFNVLVQQEDRPPFKVMESPILTKGGEVRTIHWRETCMSDVHGVDDLFVVGFGVDVTDRLQAEEELRLTQFAMDNASMGVLRVRPSSRIVYANRTASSILGLSRSGMRRMALTEVIPDFAGQEWSDFWARLKRERFTTFEAEAVGGEGRDISVEFRAYHLLFKGTEMAILFFVDIGERKRVERLREDVERMVRHDLRSPTLAVQTLLVFLDKADNLTAQQRELLETAKASSGRMLGIIDLSRVLFKMEEGGYQPADEPVDLIHVTSEVATELAPLMRARKVSLVVNVDGLPVSANAAFVVRAEELPCYALLVNLIKNALEASPEGGTVTLGLSTSDVHILSVHNAGVIPKAIRAVFFEKYVTQGKTRGTGLGTYTARLIAESLGGGIAFSTSEDAGTTITVTLPLKCDTDS